MGCSGSKEEGSKPHAASANQFANSGSPPAFQSTASANNASAFVHKSAFASAIILPLLLRKPRLLKLLMIVTACARFVD